MKMEFANVIGGRSSQGEEGSRNSFSHSSPSLLSTEPLLQGLRTTAVYFQGFHV